VLKNSMKMLLIMGIFLYSGLERKVNILIKITVKQMEEGQKTYLEFMQGMSGGFYTSLFDSIARSKGENTYKLALGFPGEVWAYLEYTGMLNRLSWDVEGESLEDKFKREYPHIQL
jgi:hypothetical protein